MPELPEVETTRRGIAPGLTGATIGRVLVRERRLRWPIPHDIESLLAGQTISAVDRRAKYLLLRMDTGTLITHLGMSGNMRFVPTDTSPGKHDHVDIELETGVTLRFNDPRRFGCMLWTDRDPLQHPLLASLGPEPLSAVFSGEYLHDVSRGRRIAIKPHLMNARVVVGVGNIYANESLYLAGIHPKRAAGRISRERMDRLVTAIKEVLADSIRYGGTTLRDFYAGDGRPGYFRNELKVYDREGEPCVQCGELIRHVVLGQRSTYYCPSCQK